MERFVDELTDQESLILNDFSEFLGGLASIVNSIVNTELMFNKKDIQEIKEKILNESDFDKIIEVQLFHFFDRLIESYGYEGVLICINKFFNLHYIQLFDKLDHTSIGSILHPFFESIERLKPVFLNKLTLDGKLSVMRFSVLRTLTVSNEVFGTKYVLDIKNPKLLAESQIENMMVRFSNIFYKIMVSELELLLSSTCDTLKSADMSGFQTYGILTRENLVSDINSVNSKLEELKKLDASLYYEMFSMMILSISQKGSTNKINRKFYKELVSEIGRYLSPQNAENFVLDMLSYYEHLIRGVELHDMSDEE